MIRCFYKLLFVIIFTAGCGGGGDGDDVADGNTTESPSPASSLLSTPKITMLVWMVKMFPLYGVLLKTQTGMNYILKI